MKKYNIHTICDLYRWRSSRELNKIEIEIIKLSNYYLFVTFQRKKHEEEVQGHGVEQNKVIKSSITCWQCKIQIRQPLQ